MNTQLQRFALVALLALTAGLAIPHLFAVPVEAPVSLAPAHPAPMVVEKYRVLDTTRVPVQRGDTVLTLESVLNEMGAEGWQVRATIGNVIIFAR